VVFVVQDIQQVEKEGEVEVDFSGLQRRPIQSGSDGMPGQIWPSPLHQRSGECESKLLVDGRRLDLLKVASVHTVQREDFPE
jgi:hypothetical protein